MALTERSLLEAAELARLRTVELVTRFLPYSTKGRLPTDAAAGPGVPRRSGRPGGCWAGRPSTSGEAPAHDRAAELSIVMPVFKEGEAVEPVLRALDRGRSRTPHEILVVYDFDEDPTVPVIARLAAELPAGPRPPQRPRVGASSTR